MGTLTIISKGQNIFSTPVVHFKGSKHEASSFWKARYGDGKHKTAMVEKAKEDIYTLYLVDIKTLGGPGHLRSYLSSSEVSENNFAMSQKED